MAGIASGAAPRGTESTEGAFQELARSRRAAARTRLGLAELVDPENPADAYREIYALLDEEIVESLASGGPFAAPVKDRVQVHASTPAAVTLRRGSRSGPPANDAGGARRLSAR